MDHATQRKTSMASTQPFTGADRPPVSTAAIHDNWQLLLVEGIILSVLGLAAIVIPPLASLVTTFFVGLMLFVGGIVGLVSTIWARRVPGFWWSFISGLAAIIAGGVIVFYPAIGLLSLTSLMIAYFVVSGVMAIIQSLRHREARSGGWEWLLAYGILELVIAGLLIAGMPGAFTWALGLIIGIDLLFGGGTLIAMALAASGPESARRPEFGRTGR
jgi:uncharacterized membrane protein HdeD (DUF308 family)